MKYLVIILIIVFAADMVVTLNSKKERKEAEALAIEALRLDIQIKQHQLESINH